MPTKEELAQSQVVELMKVSADDAVVYVVASAAAGIILALLRIAEVLNER